MTPQEIFDAVESSRFDALVNLASGITLFVRMVEEQPEFKTLIDNVREDEIATRVLSLTGQPFDTSYQHPLDTAVAVYIWALAKKHESFAHRIAAEIPSKCGWWWAKHIIEYIR